MQRSTYRQCTWIVKSIEITAVDRDIGGFLAFIRELIRYQSLNNWYMGDTLNFSSDVAGRINGLNDSDRGQIGVRSKLGTEGCTTGPPAEREYAVDPVGVDTINL